MQRFESIGISYDLIPTKLIQLKNLIKTTKLDLSKSVVSAVITGKNWTLCSKVIH